MPKASTKSYALRIEGPLVKPLQALKKQHRRSLNAEINAALEAWVAAQQLAAPSEAAPDKPDDAAPVETNGKQPTARKQSRRKRQGASEEGAPAEQTDVAGA
ncbi:MAG TPA: hypothetical protein VGK33_06955 [Chloroflexota bacterium]